MGQQTQLCCSKQEGEGRSKQYKQVKKNKMAKRQGNKPNLSMTADQEDLYLE